MDKVLVILVGAPGSGKTWFSSKLNETDERWRVVSSDAFRLNNYGEVDIFRSPFKTFRAIDYSVVDALGECDFVCYDACSLTKLRRYRLLKRVHRRFPDIKVIGLVFNTPLKKCIEQDKSKLRDHHVGYWIVLSGKILFKLNRPTLHEGFDRLMRPYDFLENLQYFMNEQLEV